MLGRLLVFFLLAATEWTLVSSTVIRLVGKKGSYTRTWRLWDFTFLSSSGSLNIARDRLSSRLEWTLSTLALLRISMWLFCMNELIQIMYGDPLMEDKEILRANWAFTKRRGWVCSSAKDISCTRPKERRFFILYFVYYDDWIELTFGHCENWW